MFLPAVVLVHVVPERLWPREDLAGALLVRARELPGRARVESRVPLVVALGEEARVAVLALEPPHAGVPRAVRPLGPHFIGQEKCTQKCTTPLSSIASLDVN